LNFGHTLGHALEAEGGFSRLAHGEAIALGMVGALRLGSALGVTPPDVAGRVVALLDRLGLPTALASQPVAAAVRWIGLDEKRRGREVDVVLLRTLGDAVRRRLPLEELAVALGAG
jgi:3-dehydroquinate synthetase